MMHGGGGEEDHGGEQQPQQQQQMTVPPGFRFHPTDEELLYYYLKKKVSYEAIDLDVIREVDLNKLEPWDLKEKCRIGTGPQNEWYFFSHKDKKYPTGTRTNRATAAGFWKATGRDKAIYLTNAKRIGMRKTLVFYTGRAPHGQKTDWIMHEYRLDDDSSHEVQEDGWVVCRVFKKKNHVAIPRGYQVDIEQDDIRDHRHHHHHQDYHHYPKPSHHSMSAADPLLFTTKQPYPPPHQFLYGVAGGYTSAPMDGTMNLPQLSSPDSTTMGCGPPSIVPPPPSLLGPIMSLNSTGIDLDTNSHNLLRLSGPSGSVRGSTGLIHHAHEQQRFSGGDWSFLDKLLTNYQTLDHHQQQQQIHDRSEEEEASHPHHNHHHHHLVASEHVVDDHHQGSKFPFQYLGNDN